MANGPKFNLEFRFGVRFKVRGVGPEFGFELGFGARLSRVRSSVRGSAQGLGGIRNSRLVLQRPPLGSPCARESQFRSRSPAAKQRNGKGWSCEWASDISCTGSGVQMLSTADTPGPPFRLVSRCKTRMPCTEICEVSTIRHILLLTLQ